MIRNPYKRVLEFSSTVDLKRFKKAIKCLPQDNKYDGSRGVKATEYLDAIKKASSIYAWGKSVTDMEVEYAPNLLSNPTKIVNLFEDYCRITIKEIMVLVNTVWTGQASTFGHN